MRVVTSPSETMIRRLTGLHQYPFRQAVESCGRPMEPGVHSEPITFLSGRLPLLSAHRSTA